MAELVALVAGWQMADEHRGVDSTLDSMLDSTHSAGGP